MNPRFSIITVTLNSATTLRETLESVRRQSWKNVELIVVDGASTDGTLDIVHEYDDVVSRLISEPDNGLYDAMNKGVRAARGDIVYFLNSDDRLCDKNVLHDVARAFVMRPETDFLYGNVIYLSPTGERLRRFEWITRRKLVFGDLCHQATFARRDLFNRLGAFDLGYPTNADFDWILRVFRSGAVLQYLDRNIAYFRTGGLHTRNPASQHRERLAVKHKYVSPLTHVLGNWMLRAELKLRRLLGNNV